jgi:hypothetical protein
MTTKSTETAREIFLREIADNPRFKLAEPSGQGIIILGARPPTKKEHSNDGPDGS